MERAFGVDLFLCLPLEKMFSQSMKEKNWYRVLKEVLLTSYWMEMWIGKGKSLGFTK
jgi:hypothetical protein